MAASSASSCRLSGSSFGISASSSARRPGKRLIRSRIFLPIFAASPATGTIPAADQAASPHLPRRDRGDEVADVADREQPDEDLAGEVLEAGADGIVVVRALPERRVAADRAAGDVVDAGVVGGRVVVVAVELAVAVGVLVERVGAGVELGAVGEPVAVGVGEFRGLEPRSISSLSSMPSASLSASRGLVPSVGLLVVGDAVAVGVGVVRVAAVLGLVAVGEAVAVAVGVLGVGAVALLDAVRDAVAVAVAAAGGRGAVLAAVPQVRRRRRSAPPRTRARSRSCSGSGWRRARR